MIMLGDRAYGEQGHWRAHGSKGRIVHATHCVLRMKFAEHRTVLDKGRAQTPVSPIDEFGRLGPFDIGERITKDDKVRSSQFGNGA